MPKAKKKVKAAPRKKNAATFNQEAHWKAYKELQMRAEAAWAKLREDLHRKAHKDDLLHDHKQLLLVLGECDYMAREYMRMWHNNTKNQ